VRVEFGFQEVFLMVGLLGQLGESAGEFARQVRHPVRFRGAVRSDRFLIGWAGSDIKELDFSLN
jgi:hypothetical protein